MSPLRLEPLLACALIMCGGEDPSSDAGSPDDAAVAAPAAARVSYASDALFDAPWPDERLRGEDGTVCVDGFPNPLRAGIVDQLKGIVCGAAGFGVSSTIYLPLDGPIDPATLPSLGASAGEDATAFVMDVDPDGGAAGTRAPADVAFLAAAGPYAENVVALLPLQGRPLAPNRLYAAVLTTGVRGRDGAPLAVAPATAALVRGERPPGLSEAAHAAHRVALAALAAAGVDLARVASTAVFRTWDPTAELRAARAQLLAGAPPELEADFTAAEVYDELCVFHTTVRMPDLQSGDAPYSSVGGTWVRDGEGFAIRERALANVWVTVPRAPMPAGGFPTAVFVRTGGGGDRPMVDRGPRATAGGATVPGTGPARGFARAGFAGISVDGPLGGLRNVDGWDEQFAIFNINNPAGLRDNVRQSALELIHFTRLVPAIAIDASSCPGLVTPGGDGVVELDGEHLAIMGHSMGATIAPLAVALEPAYRALILSGAGGSWIRNVVYKERPVHVRPAAETLLRYGARGIDVVEHDPALALLQWAGEPADPQVYPLHDGAQHVLMFQGILDTYIPPPVANPLSLALGLDHAGSPLDETLGARFTPLGELLSFSGGRRIPLPAAENRGGATRVVVQHLEDGIEDGHEVAFQRAEPPLQYRCFLEGLRAGGAPRVPASDATGCD
ncbi:MAG: hypothetical protein KF729_25510 [Sandaracinaceae bacterium]|nr:hypothetical protein [Sandaracinaceae bacterium]